MKARGQRPTPSRRTVIQGTGAAALLGFLGCRPPPSPKNPADARARGMRFAPVPPSHADEVVVPAGYRYQVLSAWGDPVAAGAAAFDPGADAAAQARAAGMGCDGMAFFPLPRGSTGAQHGLLAVNYEYTDDGLLHPNGMEPWTADKAAKSKAAHGVGVLEVARDAGGWRLVPGSAYGRRITADTLIAVSGPAAGHPWMRTADDRGGRTVHGTFGNCACGKTPWGTYLTCEENTAPYFINDAGEVPRLHQRYGVGPSKDAWAFRWEEFDPRFDAARYPNEPNRFGWVVEVDPYDPRATPMKRTALGRFSHEGATVTLARDGRVVVYMGDDDFRTKFEHIYKFVSRRPYRAGSSAAYCRELLDDGTLYAARFDADGRGWWLPLSVGEPGLDAAHGFPTQAEVVIDARTAADIVGATYMDRPEWIAVHPETGDVFCSLTNNSLRGSGKPFGAAIPLGADGANPRAPNSMGHIIRWAELDRDAGATQFTWSLFLLAGDPTLPDPLKRGNVRGAVAFSMPDGLVFDERGVLWICTDASAKDMATPDWANIGNNQLLAADPTTGEVKRFLTGPVGCEITGVTFAPGGTTMFVNIQHPGEPPIAHPARNDPSMPKALSSWPDGAAGTRPRSATIVISREDGGVIGS
jgi:secreted PhoX family phosphatase